MLYHSADELLSVVNSFDSSSVLRFPLFKELTMNIVWLFPFINSVWVLRSSSFSVFKSFICACSEVWFLISSPFSFNTCACSSYNFFHTSPIPVPSGTVEILPWFDRPSTVVKRSPEAAKVQMLILFILSPLFNNIICPYTLCNSTYEGQSKITESCQISQKLWSVTCWNLACL